MIDTLIATNMTDPITATSSDSNVVDTSTTNMGNPLSAASPGTDMANTMIANVANLIAAAPTGTSPVEGMALKMNNPSVKECHFNKMPPEILTMVLEMSWKPRQVTIQRTIIAHRAEKRAPNVKGKDSISKQGRRRHRDKILHSNAVMHTQWDGKPSEIAAMMGADKSLKYELHVDKDETMRQSTYGPNLNPRHRGAVIGSPDPKTLPDAEIEKRAASRRKMSFYERQRHGRDATTLAKDLDRVTTIATSRRRNPETLWINRACRAITLSTYTLAFALPGNNSKQETQIYFNFKTDMLKIPRHVQLWRTFTKIDLSKLVHVTIPEVCKDISGDTIAVGSLVDLLYTQDEAGKTMLERDGWRLLPDADLEKSKGKWLSTLSDSERMESQMADSLEMIHALMPSLKTLTFVNFDACNLQKEEGLVKCHIKHRNPDSGYSGNHLDNHVVLDMPNNSNKWASLHLAPVAQDYQMRPLWTRRELRLDQAVLTKATAIEKGFLKNVEFPLRNGGVVVFKAVNHDVFPKLEAWEPQLRLPSWGRAWVQTRYMNNNLGWILEMGGEVGHRRCETLDYEL